MRPRSGELQRLRMFLNGVDVISSELDNISLNLSNMQPKPERGPVCPKAKLPLLELTPSEKKADGSPPGAGAADPWLLRPRHDIPPTPPPQTEPMPTYPDRMG